MQNKLLELGEPIRTEKIQIDGKIEMAPVFKVDIEKLYYNDDNGRIATFISEYNAENPEGINSLSFEEYNDTLMKYVKKSGSKDKFNTTKNDIAQNGQLKTGIVLKDGRIIDGNRRFTCLRELYKETFSEKYKYFECFVLPMPRTEQEKTAIKTLELKYQFGEDQREEYNPIDRLVHVYNCLVVEPVMFTPEEYKKRVNDQIKLSDIKMSMMKAEIMVEYLEYINKPHRYDIARDEKLDGPIQEIANLKKKIKDEFVWSEVSSVLYSFLNKNKKGDKTREIRDLIRVYNKNPLQFEKLKESTFEMEIRKEELRSKVELTNVVTSEEQEEIRNKANELNRTFDKAVADTKKKQAREKQVDIVKSSYKKIQEIDIKEIKYIPNELKKEMKNTLEYIKNIIKDIEGALDAE